MENPNIQKFSQEFLERSRLIELQKEADEFKHKFKMEELNFERQSQRILHDQILERGRITRAEERKLFMDRRANYQR